ncbi:MAG: hypothetical protein ACUVX9_09065 [Anaerolineae bacterium]
MATLELDASGLHYRELNTRLRALVAERAPEVVALRSVVGQRYLGTGLRSPLRLEIHGTPGNDLGAFMDGPTVVVHGNAQDGVGNTLNAGEIVVHGRAGDIVGYSMRSGRVFVRDDVGYRAGIHMKAYGERQPVLVIGGTAQPYLGEYMAGGVILLLGLTLPPGTPHCAEPIGSGMHGGAIYLRGTVEPWQLGREVGTAPLNEADRTLVAGLVQDYARYFGANAATILEAPFIRLFPLHLRPYGNLYAY